MEDPFSSSNACGKTLTPAALEELVPRYPVAKERAGRLDKKHLHDGSAPYSNPSTNIWQLVDRIRDSETG